MLSLAHWQQGKVACIISTVFPNKEANWFRSYWLKNIILNAASRFIFQKCNFLAKHRNTFCVATYVVSPQHEASARSLAALPASNQWATLENRNTFVPLPTQTYPMSQTAVGGCGAFILVFASRAVASSLLSGLKGCVDTLQQIPDIFVSVPCSTHTGLTLCYCSGIDPLWGKFIC